MGHLVTNSFASYDLTEQEALQGAVLNGLQKQVLQNLLSNAALEKVALEYDATNPSQFMQQEASLKGQIDILTFLIDSSDIAEKELLTFNSNSEE